MRGRTRDILIVYAKESAAIDDVNYLEYTGLPRLQKNEPDEVLRAGRLLNSSERTLFTRIRPVAWKQRIGEVSHRLMERKTRPHG